MPLTFSPLITCPVIDKQNRPYFTSYANNVGSYVYAVSTNGGQRWRKTYRWDVENGVYDYVAASPALNGDGSVLYVSVASYDVPNAPYVYYKTLYAYDTADGHEIWSTTFGQTDVESFYISSPVVDSNDAIYLVDYATIDTLYCFDDDGSQRFAVPHYRGFFPALNPNGSEIYCYNTVEYTLDALSTTNGNFIRTILDDFYWENNVMPWLMVDQLGYLYIPSYGEIVSYTPTGTILWTASDPDWGTILSAADSPADNSIVIISDDVNFRIIKLSKTDGHTIWYYDLSEQPISDSASIDSAGNIYCVVGDVLTGYSSVIALDMNKNKLWQTAITIGGTVAIGDGVVYVCSPLLSEGTFVSNNLTRLS